MTLTVNKNIARGLNTLGYWVGTFFQVTPDNNYPTGGYSLPASALKLGVIEYLEAFICPATAAGATAIVAAYNYSTNKLQFYNTTTGAPSNLVEIGNGVDISAFSGRGVAFGKG